MERHKDPFSVEVGRRIERRRRLLGLMQMDVAERICVKPVHISQLEAGYFQSMKFRYFAALARVLGTSADYLLSLTDDDPGEIPPRRCPGTGVEPTCGSLSPVHRHALAEEGIGIV